MTGCSDAVVSSYDLYGTVTLRTALSNLAGSTDWTFSQENFLQTDEHTLSRIRLPAGSFQNTESLFISLLSFEKPVYPFLEGFSLLDSRVLPVSARSLLDSVLQGCKEKKFASDFFSSDLHFLKTTTEYELQMLPSVDSWIIGYVRALDSGVYEIPVRLFSGQDFFDAYIYIVGDDSGTYKIEHLFFKETKR